jgi:hypothetical protein
MIKLCQTPINQAQLYAWGKKVDFETSPIFNNDSSIVDHIMRNNIAFFIVPCACGGQS